MKNLRPWHVAWFVFMIGLASCSGIRMGSPGWQVSPSLFNPQPGQLRSESLVQFTPTPEPTPAQVIVVAHSSLFEHSDLS